MIIRAASALIALALCTVASSGAVAAKGKCDIASIRKLAPKEAVIDSVEPLASPVAHCEVIGHTITRDPGPNRVEWSVMLPDDDFKGRYYFIGEGGTAGFVPTTRGVEGDNVANYEKTFAGTEVLKSMQRDTAKVIIQGFASTAVQKMAEGFAVAGTDTGHKGFMWDFMIDNPAAKFDNAHRGAHVAAVATQAITRGYYKMKDKLYRYHLGCSGGGRMGAMAALHHPEDYDGIVASTGFGTGGALFPWIIQYLVENPNRWISPAKLAFLERKISEHCAEPDGLPREQDGCGFKVSSLRCKGKSTDECLTQDEIDMVNRVTSRYPTGPGTDAGGFALTHPIGWGPFLLGNTRPTSPDLDNPWAPNPSPSSFWITQSLMRGVYFEDHKPSILKDLDYKNPAHLQMLADHHHEFGAGNADLSGYKKAGGKFILWAPLGENAVPPASETEYYEFLKKKVPETDTFMRVYEVPGVWHCSGGPGPQDSPERFLDKVIAWAEEGKRPDEIVVNGTPARGVPQMVPAGIRSGPQPKPSPIRSVLVCPYPQKAVFAAKKGAFPYDAANWKCEK